MPEPEAQVPVEAPATEVEAAPETPEPSQPEAPAAPTVAEALQPEEPKPNLVPEAALISEKKGRKEAERRIKELEAQVQAGASRSEVSDDIDSILNEYGLDDTNKQFFNKIVERIEKRAEARADAKAEERLKPITEREKAERLNTIFSQHFSQAIEAVPEFKDIANPEVIKTLSLAPENQNKTFVQIIEETYGNAVPGRRTIESATPGGGKAPEPIDFDRAKRDDSYLSEVLKDPVRKEEYNANLIKRLTS